MSFVDNLNAVKIRLENNSALNDYALSHFGRQYNVKRVYKKRVEINMADLPLIMITRPSVRREIVNNVVSKEHSLILYAGFYENNFEKAQDHLIEIDELIETAVLKKTALAGDKAMPLTVTISENDEGIYHPIYFLAMTFTVKNRT